MMPIKDYLKYVSVKFRENKKALEETFKEYEEAVETCRKNMPADEFEKMMREVNAEEE